MQGKIEVPQAHQQGWDSFFGLTDEKRGMFVAALGDLECVDGIDLEVHASRKSDVALDDSSEIIRMLFGMCEVCSDSSIDPSEFVELLESGTGKIEASPTARLDLAKALKSECIQVSCKALGLGLDYPRLFLDARAHSEIRPVFSSDQDSNSVVRALVLNHTLVLRYREERLEKEFSIALDRNDLEVLQKVLQNAITENDTVIGSLSSGYPWIVRNRVSYAD